MYECDSMLFNKRKTAHILTLSTWSFLFLYFFFQAITAQKPTLQPEHMGFRCEMKYMWKFLGGNKICSTWRRRSQCAFKLVDPEPNGNRSVERNERANDTVTGSMVESGLKLDGNFHKFSQHPPKTVCCAYKKLWAFITLAQRMFVSYIEFECHSKM